MTSTLHFREALIEAAADVASGVVPLSFASELPVLRNDRKAGQYWEVLSHGPGDANLGFLNRDGDLLCDHDEKQIIGKIAPGSARVCSDRKTRCKAIVTDAAWLDRVKSGWRGGVSVGYMRKKIVRQEVAEDGRPVFYYEWQPYECSLLNVEPADSTVGLYRKKSMNTSLEEILALVLSGSRKPVEPQFTREACREYSLLSVLRQRGMTPAPRTLEYDLHNALGAGVPGGRHVVCGTMVPFAALLPRTRDARDMTATGGVGPGGALVTSDWHPAIELLFTRVVAVNLGATVVTGLTGNYIAPKVSAAPTGTIVSEIGAATPSALTFEQPTLAPCRATMQIPISMQLLQQTSGAAEDIIRRTVRRALGVLVDRLSLFGLGGNSEPQGLLNTPGIGTVTFGGAATWANVLLFEENLSLENADGENMGWAISPTTRNKWKQASKIVATNFPSFIMQGGTVNDYPALVSNQLGGQNQAVLGNWPDFYILIWGEGGIDMVLDTVTQAPKGEAILTAHVWFNVLTQHPQSFCASTDAANQ